MPTNRVQRAAEEFNKAAQRTRMPGRCDETCSFESTKLSGVVDLWREKSSAGGVPVRSDFNARTLQQFLPNVMMVDVVEDGARRRHRVRLTGTAVAALLGDYTGKFLDDAVVSPYRERWAAAVEAAIAAGEPMRLFGRIDYRAQQYLEAEILVAPLDSGEGVADSVLVVLYAKYSMRHLFEPNVRNAIAASRD